MNIGFLYAIGAAVTWGLVYTIEQRILRGAAPFALLFIDTLITAVLLLPIFFFDKKEVLASVSSFSGRVWIFIIASLALTALANFFIFSSIKVLGADTASIFEIIYPFFVVLFSYFAFQAVPNLWFAAGGLLIFCGSALIVFFGR